jgi:hypothetical protein
MQATEVVISSDPVDEKLQEQQEQHAQQQDSPQQDEAKDEEKEKDKKADDDDGSADASLGLINTAPVQLKNELEQPVTSGGMDVMIEGPPKSD